MILDIFIFSFLIASSLIAQAKQIGECHTDQQASQALQALQRFTISP